MEATQLKQADEHYKKGEAALKTGLFKWKKDYESALMYFGDAAKEYKACKQIIKAIQAHQKVVDIAKKTLDHWAVAHNIELLITLQIENNIEITPQKIHDLVEEAVSYYRQDNSGRNSVLLCQKMAKYLTKLQENDLAQSLIKIAKAEQSELGYQSSELILQNVKSLLENQQIDEAIQTYMDEIDKEKGDLVETPHYSTYQYILGTVVLFIYKHNPEEAEEFLNDCTMNVKGFAKLNESSVADKLIFLYKQGDQEGFQKLISSYQITSLNPIILVKLIQKVKVPSLVVHASNPENQANEFEEQLKNKML